MSQHFEAFYSSTFECMMKQVGAYKARKLFDEGHTVYLHPSKMRFDNAWQSPVPVSKELWEHNMIISSVDPFDNACNHFKVYNCDGERGKGINYFIQVKL